MAGTAWAQGVASNAAAQSAGAVAVLIDGVPVEFDVAPRIENSRVLVPFRPVAEALGATVEWRADTQTVLATDGKRHVRLKVGTPAMHLDDAALPLDVPARIADGRTLIPLRAFSAAFGARIEWDGEARTARVWTPPRPVEVLGYYALGDPKTSSWTELFGRPYPERDGSGASRLVSDVALGWFTLTAGGELLTSDARSGYRRPDGWEDVLRALGAAGIRGEMMVFASDHDGALTRLLLDPAAAERVARAIGAAAAPFAGVHLDLEGLGLAEQKPAEQQPELERVQAALTAFVRMVREQLSAAPGRPPGPATLSLALHAPNSAYRGYDYAALGQLADRIVLMAYDYGRRGRPEPLERVQEAVRLALRDVPRDRLLLGISAASEDAASIRAKVGVAKRAGLRGIALWRLGIIGPQRLQAIESMIEPRTIPAPSSRSGGALAAMANPSVLPADPRSRPACLVGGSPCHTLSVG